MWISKPLKNEYSFWQHGEDFLQIWLHQVGLNDIEKFLFIFEFQKEGVHPAWDDSKPHAKYDLIKLVTKAIDKEIGCNDCGNKLANHRAYPIDAQKLRGQIRYGDETCE